MTGGHVCAVGARQWMVGWNVTMMVGSHFHCCSVGGDYRRSAIAVEAMDMRSAVEGGVKSGRRQAGRGLRVVKSGVSGAVRAGERASECSAWWA